MRKRPIVLLLASSMLIGTIAACAPPTPDVTPTASPAASGQETPPPPQEREVITINVGINRANSPWDARKDVNAGWNPLLYPQNDSFAKLLFDRFQVIIEPIFFEQPNPDALCPPLPNTQNHVFLNDHIWDIGIYTSLVLDKTIRIIPYSMIDKYPRIKDLMDVNGLYAKSFAQLHGFYDGVFHLPKPLAYTEGGTELYYATSPRAIYYRQDWADTLGIGKPSTLGEYYEMLKRFTTEDPNGNGLADEFGLSSPGVRMLLGGAAYSCFAVSVDGQIEMGLMPFMDWSLEMNIDGTKWMYNDETRLWEPGIFTSNFADMLEFYHKLTEEGILDLEFPPLTYDTVTRRFASDTIGAFPFIADAHFLYETIYTRIGSAMGWTQDESLERIGTIGMLKRHENDTPKAYATNTTMGNGGVMFFGWTTDETLERYLEVHDWLLSEEAKRWGAFGQEGVHWKWSDDETRIIPFTDPQTGKRFIPYAHMPLVSLCSIATHGMDLSGESNPAPPTEPYKKRAAELRDQWRRYSVLPENNIAAQMVYLPQEQEALLSFNLDLDGEFILTIQGTTPAREAHAKLVQRMMDAGFDVVIEKFNQKMTELGVDPRGVGLPAN